MPDPVPLILAVRTARCGLRSIAPGRRKEMAQRWKETCPPIFRDTTWKTDTQIRELIASRIQAVMAVGVAGPSIWVWHGGFGTGKSTWAWKAIVNSQRWGEVVTFNHMVRTIRKAWKDGAEWSEEEALDAYHEPDLLIIDEVSSHATIYNAASHLYDVVNRRYEAGKQTWLITNDDPDTFGKTVGPALVSRIMGEGGFMDFGKDDYRKERLGIQ